MAEPAPAFEMRGISKHFPGVKALDDVGFTCHHGEIHALCGENGAGKSTLMKILGGDYQPDSGEIRLDGRTVVLRHPAEARARGVSVVHQELSLLPDRTVAENLFVGREPTRWGLLDHRRMATDARELLTEVGAADSIMPDALARDLSIGQQQLVEIAKNLATQARILVMDEPTAALDDTEARTLFDVVEALRRNGRAIVYITHRMPEMFRLADRVTVLKDGQRVGTYHVKDIDPDTTIRLMVGREVSDFYPPTARDDEIGAPQLELHDVSNTGVSSASLIARRGEILGIAGLEGSGKAGLARGIFGIDRFRSGEVRIAGRNTVIASPRDAIRANVGYLSDDRKQEGLVLMQSVRDNALLAVRGCVAAAMPLRRTRLNGDDIDGLLRSMDVRARGFDQEIQFLSGGNQQKVIIARWLAMTMSVLVFVEPTRGIDVNAKASIYRLLRELARSGMAVIVVSSDLLEILGTSDRVMVMHEGRTAGELPHGSSEETLMRMATGHATTQPRETA